jgi:hypothetical protein
MTWPYIHSYACSFRRPVRRFNLPKYYHIHEHTYTTTFIHTHTNQHTYIASCMHSCIHSNTYAYVHTHTHSHAHRRPGLTPPLTVVLVRAIRPHTRFVTCVLRRLTMTCLWPKQSHSHTDVDDTRTHTPLTAPIHIVRLLRPTAYHWPIDWPTTVTNIYRSGFSDPSLSQDEFTTQHAGVIHSLSIMCHHVRFIIYVCIRIVYMNNHIHHRMCVQ